MNANLTESAYSRDMEDCIVARALCCGRIVFVTVNQPQFIDKKIREKIGSLATDGFSIEHMPAAEVRKQYCGCRCK